MKKKISSFKVQLVIVFILIAFLAYFFPYSGDDWAWGSSIGLERLQTGFNNYNGRYLGNIIVIILTRSHLIKCIVMSGVIVGIAYGFMTFINKKNKMLFWLTLLLIFLMPTNVLAQGVVWTSGFTNYAIPTLLIVIYMNVFKKVSQDDYKQSKYMPIFTLCLGFSNALFMENIAIYNAFISLLLLIYSYYKHRKMDIAQCMFLFGSILGLALMFSNEAYTTIINNEDGYREVAQKGNIILNAVELYFSRVYIMFSFQNVILNSAICIFVVKYSYKLLNSHKLKNIKKYLLMGCNAYLLSFMMYSWIHIMNPKWNILLGRTKYFEGLIIIGFCLVIFTVTLFEIKESLHMKKAFFIEVSIVVLLAPLFVVNPIGPRCFLPIYCLFIVLLLCFVDVEKTVVYFKDIILLSTVVSYIFLLSIYTYIHVKSEQRIQYIYECIDSESVIKVKALPYSGYVWTGDPNEPIWAERFKLYYDIPEEVEIKVK